MKSNRKRTIGFARNLRKSQTSAEDLLWSELRGRREDKLKFRRQHPVPPYILDFAERKLKLAIEVDGETHFSEAELSRDKKRTDDLNSKGWSVIRFYNGDVYEDVDAVVEAIWLKALELRERNS